MGQSIDLKKRKVVASCLHRKTLITEVVLLQTMKLPVMNKAAIPSLIITNQIVLKTKITYIQTKKSIKAPIVSKTEIKYAAKGKKDVPFFHHSSKR